MMLTAFLAGCASDSTTEPDVQEETSLTVRVEDDFGRVVPNAAVTTNPPSTQVLTDENGIAVFEGLQVREYIVYVRRSGYPTYNKNVTLTADDTQQTTIVVETQPPDITITHPQTGNFMSIYDIRFEAEVLDVEDGAIPDSSLVWTSDRDGRLGTGETVILDMMTLGRHQVTLEATDSDNKTTRRSITIDVVDYQPNSYFPLPTGAQWIYRHPTAKFSITNTSGYLEQWELFNIEVTFDDTNKRTSKMNYRVKIVTQEREFHYTIIDELEKDGDDIYIKKTGENLKMWNGNPYGTPSNELNIETTYSPRLLLLENTRDLDLNTSYQFSTNNQVKWIYDDPFFGPREFTENFTVETAITIGDEEVCTTGYSDENTYNCVRVTIDQQESKRVWWLSRGVGIIQMQYNSFKQPPTAELIITNLSSYESEPEGTARAAFSFNPAGGPVLDVDPVPAEPGLERMRALRTILGGMASR